MYDLEPSPSLGISYSIPSKIQSKIEKGYNQCEFDDMDYRHYAVITKSGRIISEGKNNMRSHPFAMKPLNCLHKPEIFNDDLRTMHAEMKAIKKVKNKSRLKGASIFIYSLNRRGELRISRPCNLCMHYIKQFGISKIYYSDMGGWKKEKV